MTPSGAVSELLNRLERTLNLQSGLFNSEYIVNSLKKDVLDPLVKHESIFRVHEVSEQLVGKLQQLIVETWTESCIDQMKIAEFVNKTALWAQAQATLADPYYSS